MDLLNRVICKVPGSTSNCGSGFDTLGLALAVHNYVTIERVGAELPVRDDLGADIYSESGMARETVSLFFKESKVEPFDVKVRIHGEVPQARGLGSSVTVRGGILTGLSKLCQVGWDNELLVRLITRLESHPDNASASILGGFTVSRFEKSPAELTRTQKFPIASDLRFVVVSPEFEVLTSSSRNILPETIDFSKAVASINSATCLVGALASGEFGNLSGVVGDHIHEPYRLGGIPGASDAIEKGVAAGAYTGWLSGSGSSVLCVCDARKVKCVAESMQKAFAGVDLDSVARDLSADNDGIQILSAE
ncbi:homoserine kinase [Puniceicoccaceae bacterium K14]|nr:homoserine kinase [Puniceicoccaceae bacterium K14]